MQTIFFYTYFNVLPNSKFYRRNLIVDQGAFSDIVRGFINPKSQQNEEGPSKSPNFILWSLDVQVLAKVIPELGHASKF